MSVDVVDAPDRARFEITVDGELVGFAQYRPIENGELVLDVFHTEIDSSRQGSGLGTELVGRMLAELHSRGARIRPTCWFVRDYVAKHLAYLDLVPVSDRERFGLASEPVAESEQT